MQHSADIVIAGGGVIGWSCAWRRARALQPRALATADERGPDRRSRGRAAPAELRRAALCRRCGPRGAVSGRRPRAWRHPAIAARRRVDRRSRTAERAGSSASPRIAHRRVASP